MEWLDEYFGHEDEIIGHDCPAGRPPVSVFVYRDTPEPGMMTGITFGISLYDHEKWVHSRPEMMVSLETQDIDWLNYLGYFGISFRGEKTFSYGDVFTTDEPLASDTKMDGFFIFAQSLLEPDGAVIQLKDYKVILGQMYPIYQAELSLYQKLGVQGFIQQEGLDVYDPGRAPLGQ